MKVNVKKALATLMATALIVTSGQCPTASAAKKPTLNTKKVTLKVGQKKTLKVKNKIKGSTYKWKSSKVKVAKVTKKGVVKAVKAGTATITCKVKTKATKKKKAKTYTLKCKVTVKKKTTPKPTAKPTTKPTAKPTTKPSDLPSDIPSDTPVNPTQAPSDNPSAAPSTEPSASPSADPSASPSVSPSASPSASPSTAPSYNYRPGGGGGTPGTSTSPAPAPTTDAEGTVIVESQAKLDAALSADTKPTTLKIESETLKELEIAEGTYDTTDVIVNAPQATITNSAKFKSVTINAISKDTWIEKAIGNALTISATTAHIRLDEGAKPTSIDIEAPTSSTTTAPDITITRNGGTAEAVNVKTVVSLTITKSGSVSDTEALPVKVQITENTAASNETLKITSSTKVTLSVSTVISATISLESGAESSEVTVEKASNTVEEDTQVTIKNSTTTTISVTDKNEEEGSQIKNVEKDKDLTVNVTENPYGTIVTNTVNALTEAVILGNDGNTASNVTKALNLQTTSDAYNFNPAVTGASIAWTATYDPAANSAALVTSGDDIGKVTQQTSATTVTLTATITAGAGDDAVEDTATFEFTIPAAAASGTVSITELSNTICTVTFTVTGSAVSGSSISITPPTATVTGADGVTPSYSYAVSNSNTTAPTSFNTSAAIDVAEGTDVTSQYLWVKVSVTVSGNTTEKTFVSNSTLTEGSNTLTMTTP